MTVIRLIIDIEDIRKLAERIIIQKYPNLKKVTIESLSKVNIIMTKYLIEPTDILIGSLFFDSDPINDITEKNDLYKLMQSNGLQLKFEKRILTKINNERIVTYFEHSDNQSICIEVKNYFPETDWNISHCVLIKSEIQELAEMIKITNKNRKALTKIRADRIVTYSERFDDQAICIEIKDYVPEKEIDGKIFADYWNVSYCVLTKNEIRALAEEYK